jgi:hypothetical protein
MPLQLALASLHWADCGVCVIAFIIGISLLIRVSTVQGDWEHANGLVQNCLPGELKLYQYNYLYCALVES